ncbi:phosphatidate cytidylyltransferase [Hymenobacter sp. M29]|uniref:Phosphatidate cytidylyltransferase n=1 Tax=Hymenobacter mellowenesis TaxID=3063995 RepID=A0ABT9A5V6_9BACT|nr:phosphatidate cytidylyltransferase [Hymenobacter sp. M29]MDO7845199.1 phosphatidate cytidylyltransferase [Hymenobacter sp. M29]
MPDSTPPIPTETSAEKGGPSNLQLRLLWGIIGAALLLGSVWFSPVTFGLFFAAVQAVMLWEFYRMMRAGGYAPATWIGVVMGTTTFLVTCSTQVYSSMKDELGELWGVSVFGVVVFFLLVLPILLIIREMLVWPKFKQPFVNIATVIGGLLYISFPMTMLVFISLSKANTYDYRRIFGLLFLIWASDIGAYAVGRAIGKHKLAPKISPGKTWEGWAGGFAMTLLVGWAIGFMLPDMPLTHRLVAAGVVAVFAPLGDLAESMLKRSVGVKDSGSIMPGHGGLLDRFDAFLLVLPVLALLQLLAE